ncbi:hypothetical protein [Streptococcus sanguinis]|nr:hypothetical protein [Streptococcus sanguinis]
MDIKKAKCQHQLFDYEADYVICPACLFLSLSFPYHIGLWVAVIGILAI